MEKYVSTAWLSSKLRDVQFLEARNLDEPFMILHALGVLWNDIKSAPAADVVPKSEADEIAEELSDTIVMKDELFDEVIKLRGELAKAKNEVAREIFEDIWRIGDTINGIILSKSEFAELKKKYTEVAE